MRLPTAIKRLASGFAFIGLAAAFLLLSDLNNRNVGDPSSVAVSGTKRWRISVVKYVDAPATEEAEQGAMDGLREAGMVAGRDYVINSRSAQGDIAVLNGIMDTVKTENADLVLTFSTSSLQVAIKKIQKTPIVFALVGNAFIAGAGRSNEDHLPNVTGATIISPFKEMFAVFREVMPAARRCGTVFTPSEVNSVYYYELLVEAAKEAGIEIEGVGASKSSEIADAALALAARKIDAVCQISDNLTGSTFVSIAQAAQRAKLPIFSFNTTQARQGASIVVGRDFHDGGREAALLAARIMRGENPASIPFQTTTRIKLVINPAAAVASRLTIPPSLLQRADEVIQPN